MSYIELKTVRTTLPNYYITQYDGNYFTSNYSFKIIVFINTWVFTSWLFDYLTKIYFGKNDVDLIEIEKDWINHIKWKDKMYYLYVV